jgi:hypothetical protein
MVNSQYGGVGRMYPPRQQGNFCIENSQKFRFRRAFIHCSGDGGPKRPQI